MGGAYLQCHGAGQTATCASLLLALGTMAILSRPVCRGDALLLLEQAWTKVFYSSVILARSRLNRVTWVSLLLVLWVLKRLTDIVRCQERKSIMDCS